MFLPWRYWRQDWGSPPARRSRSRPVPPIAPRHFAGNPRPWQASLTIRSARSTLSRNRNPSGLSGSRSEAHPRPGASEGGGRRVWLAFLFDLDGTLVDSVYHHVRIVVGDRSRSSQGGSARTSRRCSAIGSSGAGGAAPCLIRITDNLRRARLKSPARVRTGCRCLSGKPSVRGRARVPALAEQQARAVVRSGVPAVRSAMETAGVWHALPRSFPVHSDSTELRPQGRQDRRRESTPRTKCGAEGLSSAVSPVWSGRHLGESYAHWLRPPLRTD